MSNKRHIEVFSASCPVCNEAIAMVKRNACPSCEVTVLEMKDQAVSTHAGRFGVRSVPAVVIDGKLADCCIGRGPYEKMLKAAGLGQLLA